MCRERSRWGWRGLGADVGPVVQVGVQVGRPQVIIAGIVLVLLAWLLGMPAFVFWIGLILIVVGACLNVVPIAGRRRRIY